MINRLLDIKTGGISMSDYQIAKIWMARRKDYRPSKILGSSMIGILSSYELDFKDQSLDIAYGIILGGGDRQPSETVWLI